MASNLAVLLCFICRGRADQSDTVLQRKLQFILLDLKLVASTFRLLVYILNILHTGIGHSLFYTLYISLQFSNKTPSATVRILSFLNNGIQ